jgi:hypothetical protein
MTHPRSIITNLKFTYADQRKKLGGMLKYFQYRDDKDGRTHIPQIDEQGKRVPRWVDHGLGDNHRAVLDACGELATDDLKRNVGSRLLVVGPEVGLMHAVPEERRVEVLKELTEATMELWFERMDLPTPSYAFVCHESQPGDERPDGRLKEDGHSESYLHTHVVIAPTVQGLVQERESYRVYEKQIGWLHEAGRDAMEAIWERELGVEHYAELQADLTERDNYQKELDTQHERRELETAFAVERRPEPVLEHELDVIEEELDMDLGLEFGE